MYIWVAIDVNEQVGQLREKAENYVSTHGLSSPTLTLPFHISLKISFQIPDNRCQEAMQDIREFLKSLKPFSIVAREIEQNGPIIWIAMEENTELTYIHKRLDEMLLEKYGVAQHAFDKAFLFHTSVLMIDHEEQLLRAFHTMKDSNIPKVLKAETFIIGSSETGQAGTYRVNEEIALTAIC